MIAHHSSSHIRLTSLSEPRRCQDGQWNFSPWLVLIPLHSNLMRQGQRLEFFTASLSVIMRYVNWQIGPLRAESTGNFTNVTCKFYSKRASFNFCMYIVWSQYTFCIGVVFVAMATLESSMSIRKSYKKIKILNLWRRQWRLQALLACFLLAI